MIGQRKRRIWPLVVVALAATIYLTKIHQQMVDFDVYRTAASRALAGERLYRASDGHYQYKYLPAFAFAMAPFAHVEFRVARLVWYALSVGLLCACLRWSARAVPEARWSERALVWAAVIFVGKYYARDLSLGQSNVLLSAMLTGALVAARRGSVRLTGALVALGVFVKPYALILTPWVWLVAGLPGAVVGGVTLAAGLLLPALAYGWHGNLSELAAWYQTVTATTPGNLLSADNVSIATMWARWLGEGPTATGLAIATGAAALGLAGLIARGRRCVRHPASLEFGALMLLVPLLSPQGWDYVLLLGAPAVLLIVDRFGELRLPWRVLLALALAAFSFTIYDVIGRRAYAAMAQINLVSVAALVLVAGLAHLRWRKLA